MLDVLRGSGQPLAAPSREEMEARLGADLSDVRLHTGGAAHASAATFGARAYTSGSHIVIGAGGADNHTLAHELTHVLQQRQGPVAGTDHGGVKVSDPSDVHERAAEAAAQRVMSSAGRPEQDAGLPGGDRAAAAPSAPALPAIQRKTILGGVSYQAENPQDLSNDPNREAFIENIYRPIVAYLDTRPHTDNNLKRKVIPRVWRYWEQPGITIEAKEIPELADKVIAETEAEGRSSSEGMIRLGLGTKALDLWDMTWSDDVKREMIERLTPEEATFLLDKAIKFRKEKQEFKDELAVKRSPVQSGPVPGPVTTGGSPPHRKTPSGNTRALRLTYPEGSFGKSAQTNLDHLVFFLDRALELSLTLLITTTQAGQQELILGEITESEQRQTVSGSMSEKELEDRRSLRGGLRGRLEAAEKLGILGWDIVTKDPSKWAEDDVEYLESGMQVGARHFGGQALEDAMKRGRAERGIPGELNSPGGMPLGMLVNDPVLKELKEGGHRIRAYIEGGNMISGEDAAGKPVILVGLDAIYATAELYSISPDQVRVLLAEDFGVQRDQIVGVEQPGTFHLDMGMLFLGKGEVVVNNSEADKEEQPGAASVISQIIKLENEATKYLKNAGFTVIRERFRSFGNRFNFFNGEFVLGGDEKLYYLTNGGSAEEQAKFKEFLQQALGIAGVFFTPAEVAKSTLEEQGGVGCRAKGIPDSALKTMLARVSPLAPSDQ